MKILLVEDNPVDRMFVTQALQQVVDFDYELHSCETLATALARLVDSPVDVILLDLWLPDSEGLETCHRLVATVDGIPIVVMTGTNDMAIADAAIRSGAQDYMVKGSFPGSAIARVLQYAIDRSQFQRERIQQTNYFEQVLSRVPAIIWTTDLTLRVTSAMGAGLQFLNLDSREIVGKTLEEYFRATGVPGEAIRAHERALRGESVAYESEWRNRFFAVKVDPLHEPGSCISGTIGVALDITDRHVLHREIYFAHLVQKELLPAEHPRLAGFDIFGGSFPASQACGDWYDYLRFHDGSLGLVVGDVSGHGFGPAIFGSAIAAYLQVLAEFQADVQDILKSCNRLVCKRKMDDSFAVLSLARLEPGVRKLTFGGAGDGMLIVSHDGLLKHMVDSSGMPFGIQTDTLYDSPAQITLDSGDVLLQLTDGFREALNEKNKMFGVGRIIETVAANSPGSASQIFEAVLAETRKFVGRQRQQDDMTGIVVKVLDN